VSTPFKRELQRSKYRLLGLVGQGQFGRVYCASHRTKGYIVALKELDKLRFPTHKFLREMRFLVSLQHPNIVTLYALEHTRTGRYLVMDYCEGGTLRSLMEDEVRLQPLQALKLVADTLAGLDHAHSRGIIHCDIKPENILLTLTPQGWTARISDFGIARLKQDLANADMGNTGSPAYMAPERFYGEYSHASDLYAVGIFLFELLVGYRPFSGVPVELMSAHMNQAVAIPDTVPAALKPLILRALQKIPARRFRSAADMLAAVQTAAAQLGGAGGSSASPGLAGPSPLGEWAAGQLLKFTTSFSPVTFQAVYTMALAAPMRQLVVGRSGGAVGDAARGAAGAAGTEQLYQVFEDRICCWSYAQGQLLEQVVAGLLGDGLSGDNLLGDGLSGDGLPEEPGLLEDALGLATGEPVAATGQSPLQVTQVRWLTQVQGVYPGSGGCWAIAQGQLYGLTLAAFQPVTMAADPMAWVDLLTVDRGLPSMVDSPPSSPMLAAATPDGQWVATITGGQSLAVGRAQSWQVSLRNRACRLNPPTHFLALDNRYLAAFSPMVGENADRELGETTLLQVVSRRGTVVATQRLPVALRQVMATAVPYRLLALETGPSTAVLLLDLKPFRMLRIGVDFCPKLVAGAAWGYGVMAESGEIGLLDPQGMLMGRVMGPAAPTAIAPVEPYGLAIATWQNGQGHLHLVDLRRLDLDIVF
jgi:hypothetical protein